MACSNDQMLVHEIEKEVEVYVEVPADCEVVEQIVVEDNDILGKIRSCNENFSDELVDDIVQDEILRYFEQ